MSYAGVIAGLTEIFAGVAGITAVLPYEPTAIHDFPTMYLLGDAGERKRLSRSLVQRKHRVLGRLCFRWTDNEQAEVELQPFVDAVPDALDAYLLAGGTVGGAAWAEVVNWDFVFVTIGGTLLRAVDFYTEVTEK